MLSSVRAERRGGGEMSTERPAPDAGNAHIGAVEGDRPTDRPNQGNENAPGVDKDGLSNDPVATAQDRIGALLDETEGG
jgi:hypothetical protein